MMGGTPAIRSVILVIAMVVNFALTESAAPSNGPPQIECAPPGVNEEVSRHRERGVKALVRVAVLGRSRHDTATLTSAVTRRLAGTGSTRFVSPQEVSTFRTERERGISIRRSLVTYETETRRYVHLHAPEFIDDVKLLITDAIPLEGALLVVSSVEDLDRRYVRLLRNVNVRCVVVFLDRGAGSVHSAELDLAEHNIRRLLSQHGYPGDALSVIRGSLSKALEGEDDASIDALLRAMSRHLGPPIRAEEQPLLMPVEDIFFIPGRGTVVTGRVERGVLKVGDDVEIVGLAKETRRPRVAGLEMFRKLLDEARAGDNVGVLLRGIEKEKIERGQVLAAPGSIKPCTTFRSDVYVLTGAEGGRRASFPSRYRPQFYFRTTDVTGTAIPPADVPRVRPGDHVTLTVELLAPVALERGLRFAIREGGRTVGAGVVTEMLKCSL